MDPTVKWHYDLADKYGIPRYGIPYRKLELPLANAMQADKRNYYAELNAFLAIRAQQLESGRKYLEEVEKFPVTKPEAMRLVIAINQLPDVFLRIDLDKTLTDLIAFIRDRVEVMLESYISLEYFNVDQLSTILKLDRKYEAEIKGLLADEGVIAFRRKQLVRILEDMGIADIELVEKSIRYMGSENNKKYLIY